MNTARLLISPAYPFSATGILSCIVYEEIGLVLGTDLGLCSKDSLPNLILSDPMTLDCRSFLCMGLDFPSMTQLHSLLWFMDTLLHSIPDFLGILLLNETSIAPGAHSSLWLIQPCRTAKAELILPAFLVKRKIRPVRSMIRIIILKTKSFIWLRFSLNFEKLQKKKNLCNLYKIWLLRRTYS